MPPASKCGNHLNMQQEGGEKEFIKVLFRVLGVTGRGQSLLFEKGNYYADPSPRFQLNWRRNRTFLAAFQTELELSL
ncbi:hypothetical protein CEXT_538301, partial [Caerostris extrusa]